MRPSWERTWLNIALEMAKMGTCIRRQVGCVLVTERNRQLAAGFNGVPPGWPHCNDGHLCPGAAHPSGTGLDECYSNHAEANAIGECRDTWAIHTAYVTASPCVSCIKALMCTSTKRIVFLEEYPQPSAKDLWLRHGGVWMPYPVAS
jgi:dCMP deaminase